MARLCSEQSIKMVRNERRRSMSQSDASFFIARSSVDLGSLGRESAKDTLVVIIHLSGEGL